MDEKFKFREGENADRVLCFLDSGGDEMTVSIEDPPRTGAYFMVISINGGDAVGLSSKEALSFAAAIVNEVNRETES